MLTVSSVLVLDICKIVNFALSIASSIEKSNTKIVSLNVDNAEAFIKFLLRSYQNLFRSSTCTILNIKDHIHRRVCGIYKIGVLVLLPFYVVINVHTFLTNIDLLIAVHVKHRKEMRKLWRVIDNIDHLQMSLELWCHVKLGFMFTSKVNKKGTL